MALVYKDPYLSIGGTNVTTYVTSLTLNVEYDELEVTASSAGAHNAIPGLQNWSIDVVCNQSWAAGELSSVIDPLLGAASASAIIVKPNGSATSTSNPKWTGNGRIFSAPVIDGGVGDLAKLTFTIKPGDGTALARATAD